MAGACCPATLLRVPLAVSLLSLSPLSPPQVCGEKNRFEKLMEYFRNEDTNIDFMVSGWRGCCSAVPRALCPQGLQVLSPMLGTSGSHRGVPVTPSHRVGPGLPTHRAVPMKLCPQESLVHPQGAASQGLSSHWAVPRALCVPKGF